MLKQLFAALMIMIAINVSAQEKPEGLFINSKAPDFKFMGTDGKQTSLKETRKKGPVVIVFYRGYWCPYCNKYLKALQDSLQLILDKGAQLIAITPESKEGIAQTVEKTGAKFPIVTDADMKIMKAYDVAYRVDEKTVGRYKSFDIDLAKNNVQKPDAVFLPVPAVFIVDKDDGEIKYRFFEPDYKKRASIKEILENLNGLK
jgi:peroxiredoxin